MFRQNLARVMREFLWVTVPVVSILLLLPHRVEMNLEASLLPLLGILLINAAAVVLPYRENAFNRYLLPIVFLLLVVELALLSVAISLSGGVKSPVFPFLLLVTSFGCGLISSPGMSMALIGFSIAGHLTASFLFNRPGIGDAQLLGSQVFFLILLPFLFDRLSAESKRQARERARSMEELRRLAEMNRAASGFVSAVSFEMRTPLTSILGFSEMLASREMDPETEKEYVAIIRREAENLNSLVDDLLDVSRLESGKAALNREPYRLDQLIRAGLAPLEPVCDPHAVLQQIPSDFPEVMIDVRRLQRVINGMFDFISRRFGTGSEIRISLKLEEEEVVFTVNVRNREASFLREDASRPPLAHWDKSEEDLDLAIARRIIAAHGGVFSAIKASGGWLTLVTRLPLSSPGEPEFLHVHPGRARSEAKGRAS